MRIAVVAPPFYEVPPRLYGGTERVCHLLVEGLIDRGHDITLIAAGDRHTRAHFIQTFPQPPSEGTEHDTAIEVLHAARTAAVLSDLQPDIVHDHTRAGPLTASGRSTPTVVTVHGATSGSDPYRASLDLFGRWVGLVAISHAQRSAASHFNWVATVYNGIRLSSYPFRAHKDDYVAYVGRISPDKGVHLAIDAARAAGRRLLIGGSWTIPSERSYFDEHIRPRLGRGVEWLGEVDDRQKQALLAGAQCLVYPACWAEPFGLALVEAMACGTPVVALDAGSLSEVIADGVTGVVCRTPSELAGAIERVSRLDPHQCRARVAAHFDARDMVQKYESLYDRLLETRLGGAM